MPINGLVLTLVIWDTPAAHFAALRADSKHSSPTVPGATSGSSKRNFDTFRISVKGLAKRTCFKGLVDFGVGSAGTNFRSLSLFLTRTHLSSGFIARISSMSTDSALLETLRSSPRLFFHVLV